MCMSMCMYIIPYVCMYIYRYMFIYTSTYHAASCAICHYYTVYDIVDACVYNPDMCSVDIDACVYNLDMFSVDICIFINICIYIIIYICMYVELNIFKFSLCQDSDDLGFSPQARLWISILHRTEFWSKFLNREFLCFHIWFPEAWNQSKWVAGMPKKICLRKLFSCTRCKMSLITLSLWNHHLFTRTLNLFNKDAAFTLHCEFKLTKYFPCHNSTGCIWQISDASFTCCNVMQRAICYCSILVYNLPISWLLSACIPK